MEKWDDRDCKKHNLDNIANAVIFKTLDPITFSKIEHLKTTMEIWQVSFDLLDERFHKILSDLASLNHVLPPKEKNVRKPGHWKSACPYPKVEKYGERERNEKKKKAMVAAESDESSSSSSDEKTLVCMERRAEKSNHEDRWTMSEDDTLCLMAKNDADQEVTSQTTCSSYYESIPTFKNLFEKFKKMMEDFEEINLKHSSLSEENKLLSEENLKLTEGQKSQLSEITQIKAGNESLSEKVKSLKKELGILKSKEAVDKLLETTKHKGREGLGFDPSSSKKKGRTTFIPPKPTAKSNKQKGKEKEKPTEVPKKLVPPKNYRKLDTPQKEAAKHPGVWYLDSGCSRHMTGDASLLSNLIPYDGPRVTFRRSNDFGLTKGLRNLVYKGLTIQAVSYVEGLNYNLLSISQFCEKGYSMEFYKDMASLKNISTNEVILPGKRIRNIYKVIWDDVKERREKGFPENFPSSSPVSLPIQQERRKLFSELFNDEQVAIGKVAGLHRGVPSVIFSMDEIRKLSNDLNLVLVGRSSTSIPTQFIRKTLLSLGFKYISVQAISTLFTIASALGRPLKMDDSTALGQRLDRARICVEVDASLPLPPFIHIRQGDSDLSFPCIFERPLSFCSACSVLGHASASCLKKTAGEVHTGGKGKVAATGGADGGWTIVQRNRRSKKKGTTHGATHVWRQKGQYTSTTLPTMLHVETSNASTLPTFLKQTVPPPGCFDLQGDDHIILEVTDVEDPHSRQDPTSTTGTDVILTQELPLIPSTPLLSLDDSMTHSIQVDPTFTILTALGLYDLYPATDKDILPPIHCHSEGEYQPFLKGVLEPLPLSLKGKRLNNVTAYRVQGRRRIKSLVKSHSLPFLAFFEPIVASRAGSDHNPFLLECTLVGNSGPKAFRFLHVWLSHPSFLPAFDGYWRKAPTCGEEEALNSELAYDSNPSSQTRETWAQSKAKLVLATNKEMEFWKQKANLKWLEKGDSNTKLFHSFVKGRKSKLGIAHIK
ncbi:unnamed protein product [Cuscuta campestris]|uniref:Retrovirus-related Pol polyprotein from transposon TNT 1-94-like beta-barrel domain-containing protein n=1 Tax=Cuscuta campestris TaxID=132261 RepID=A0A484MVI9_9ASTE|nr:unnamed protein product [Cuscuta campestris]